MAGLGVLPGTVERFPETSLAVPNINWSGVLAIFWVACFFLSFSFWGGDRLFLFGGGSGWVVVHSEEWRPC